MIKIIKLRRSFVIIAVIALIGSIFVFRSFASTAPPVCASGSSSLGFETAYKDGKPYRIRLCRIEGFLSTGSEDHGWARVSSSASGNWVALFQAARRSRVTLVASSSFRSYATQEQLYKCWLARKPGCNQAAKPGYSNHQSGEAIDIDIVPGPNNDPPLTQCLANAKQYPTYYWLSQNAYKYKRYAHIASECWHWSPTGT